MLWINHVGSFGDTNDIPYSHFWLYHDTTGTVFAYRSYCVLIIERSLEVKLPTIWTDEKQRWEESEKRREEERESLRRKKIQVREKVGKSRNIVFFQ